MKYLLILLLLNHLEDFANPSEMDFGMHETQEDNRDDNPSET